MQLRYAGLAILCILNLLCGVVAGAPLVFWAPALLNGHPYLPNAALLLLILPAASITLAAWAWRRDAMNTMSRYALTTGVASLVIAVAPSLLVLTLVGN